LGGRSSGFGKAKNSASSTPNTPANFSSMSIVGLATAFSISLS
jgi:hypothetical protein